MQIQQSASSENYSGSLKGYSYPIKASLIAALGGLLFGFETAVISGAEKTIQQLWSLSSGWLGFTVASSLIGTVVGSLIAGIPAQRYGRKKILTFIAILYLLSSIGCAVTPVWGLFIFFRFVGGIAVGASSVVGPMYISEIAPPKIRGRLAGSFQVNIVAGILLAFLMNYLLSGIGEDSWRYMLGIMVVPSALFAILLRTIPESPRWLLLNNREAEASAIFAKTGEHDAVRIIKEEQANISLTIKENLFNGKYNKPILYAVLLAMFNQLSGINAILYYAPRIFEMAGFDKENSFIQPVYIGAANLFFTLLAMNFIDKFGRKKLLLIGAAGDIVFLALTAMAFNSEGGGGTS